MLASILSASGTSAQTSPEPTAVSQSGDTTLVARSEGFSAKVLIRSRAAERAKPTQTGYVPKSYVERIRVTVNGTELFVPYSAFCGLFDMHKAEIRLEQKTGVLLLDGGDASESYWVELEFDPTRVTRKVTGSNLLPRGKKAAETIYYEHVLK